LVLHLTVWVDVARRRLRGTAYEPSLADDFPVLPEISAMSWRAAITRLRDAIEALAVATEGLGIDQLESLTPGHDYTIRLMLLGVVEHAAYHGGQIALLTRANAAARP
jgi:hypothetical protein